MKHSFLLFWCVAGMLTLDFTLRHRGPEAPPPVAEPLLDSLPLLEVLRTQCALPPGTLVFLVRDEVSP